MEKIYKNDDVHYNWSYWEDGPQLGGQQLCPYELFGVLQVLMNSWNLG